MHSIRDIYDGLLDLETSGPDDIAEYLYGWQRDARTIGETLAPFGSRIGGGPSPEALLWELYALQRLGDLLRCGLQLAWWRQVEPPTPAVPRGSDDDGVGEVDVLAYVSFMREFGMLDVEPKGYHPFYYEILAVEEALGEPDAPAALVDVAWPALMLGDLLVARGGAVVRAGRRVLNPVHTTRSALYWCTRHALRPCVDLSHGWGGNSQWRTTPRRDYHHGVDGTGVFDYNVDGQFPLNGVKGHPPNVHDPSLPNNDLTLAQRIDLVRYRCAVQPIPEDHDLWIFDDAYHEPERAHRPS